jgi:hypothetical protein
MSEPAASSSSVPTVDPRRPGVPRRDVLLWLAVLAGPFAWAGQLGINYGLAPTACEQGGTALLHLVSLGALLLAAGGAFLAHRWWRRLPADSTEEGETGSRARFMALAGMLLGVFFSLLVMAADVPNWVMRPCA